jgi:secreted trypsin-like serine protease
MAALVVFATAAWPAAALVGSFAPAPELAPYVVMVLKRTGTASGFCSASVVAQDAVLTAAHCVADPSNTRVHFRGEHGEPVILEVTTVVTHPGYRTDAARSRIVSIDMALIRLAQPLPAPFKPLALAEAETIKAEETFRIAGFGVTQEGEGATSGVLRAAHVSARLPLSSILLWVNDPQGQGTGACTGDSGGPILALDRPVLIAVTDWAEGAGARKCGRLTQAALAAPQRRWIESVLAAWAEIP